MNIVEKELSEALYVFLTEINHRHKALEYAGYGPELYSIFCANLNAKKHKYGEIISELFYDVISKRIVSHIYDSNDWLESINILLYNSLRLYSPIDQEKIFDDIIIDTKIVVAQSNSLVSRPLDLKEPIAHDGSGLSDIKADNLDYCRIGYYEKQLYAEDKFGKGYEEKIAYGGAVFDRNQSFPYFHYRLELKKLYKQNRKIGVLLEEMQNPIISYIQNDDMFENYKILWLTNNLIDYLGLKLAHFSKGLYATNEDDEIILRFNQWNSKYLGDDIRMLIPTLSGSELLIRKDYLTKLENLYKSKAYFKINIVGD